jgi:hypothetical protein
MAIVVPCLEEIISLVGVTSGMLLAFVFPAIIDTNTFVPKMLQEGKSTRSIVWLITKNVLLLLLGVIGLTVGLWSKIETIISLIL